MYSSDHLRPLMTLAHRRLFLLQLNNVKPTITVWVAFNLWRALTAQCLNRHDREPEIPKQIMWLRLTYKPSGNKDGTRGPCTLTTAVGTCNVTQVFHHHTNFRQVHRTTPKRHWTQRQKCPIYVLLISLIPYFSLFRSIRFWVRSYVETTVPNDPKWHWTLPSMCYQCLYSQVSISFALRSTVFELHVFWRNVHWMTLKWHWISPSQIYPTNVLLVFPTSKFQSVCSTAIFDFQTILKQVYWITPNSIWSMKAQVLQVYVLLTSNAQCFARSLYG